MRDEELASLIQRSALSRSVNCDLRAVALVRAPLHARISACSKMTRAQDDTRARYTRGRAVSIVQARQVQRGRAPAADEQAGPEQSPVGNTLTFDAASFSLSWHSADGAVFLLPPRGQYG